MPQTERVKDDPSLEFGKRPAYKRSDRFCRFSAKLKEREMFSNDVAE
jgi:hypothetical protein